MKDVFGDEIFVEDATPWLLSKSFLVVTIDSLKDKLSFGGTEHGDKLLIFNRKYFHKRFIAVDIQVNGDFLLTFSYKNPYTEFVCKEHDELKSYLQELADYEE